MESRYRRDGKVGVSTLSFFLGFGDKVLCVLYGCAVHILQEAEREERVGERREIEEKGEDEGERERKETKKEERRGEEREERGRGKERRESR